MTDKLIPQSQVDALVAAALGPHWMIVYEDANRQPEMFTDETLARQVFADRQLNWNCYLFAECRTPADAQKAFAEHDAALCSRVRRELIAWAHDLDPGPLRDDQVEWVKMATEIESSGFEKAHALRPCGHSVGDYRDKNFPDSETHYPEIKPDYSCVGCDSVDKLEAENAELREALKWALGVCMVYRESHDNGRHYCIWCDSEQGTPHEAYCNYAKRRALLEKKT